MAVMEKAMGMQLGLGMKVTFASVHGLDLTAELILDSVWLCTIVPGGSGRVALL